MTDTSRYSLIDTNTQTETLDNVKFESDSRLILFQNGQRLVVRFLRFKDAISGRTENRWVSKFIHSVFTKVSEGIFKSEFTICPTTQYLGIRDGISKCKICQHTTRLYEEANEDKLKARKYEKLLKTLKRKFKMFIPVYVIEDNINPDNNGKVKIIMIQSITYLYKFLNYFKKLNDDENSLHFNNLGTVGAFNCIFEVNPKNVFDIEIGFKKSSDVCIKDFHKPEVQQDFMENIIVPLKFDEDFYDQFDQDKHDLFFEQFAYPLLVKNGVIAKPEVAKLDNIDVFKNTMAETPQSNTLTEKETSDLVKEVISNQIPINTETVKNEVKTDPAEIENEVENILKQFDLGKL